MMHEKVGTIPEVLSLTKSEGDVKQNKLWLTNEYVGSLHKQKAYL